MKSQKWLMVSVVSLTLGASNIFAVSLVARKSELPKFNLPVGQYSSYSIDVYKSGKTQSYNIKHRMHDPRIVEEVKTIKRPAGLFGRGKSDTYILKQSPVGDEFNQSSVRSPELTAKQTLCIEAGAAGKMQGRLVGSSIGTAVSPSLSGVPVLGPVLAGAATMVGMDKGAEIGSQIAKDFKDC